MINALPFAGSAIILSRECAANAVVTLRYARRSKINPARILMTENGNKYMILKVEVKKLKSTCIMLDSVLFKPIETKNDIDYYELPCELQKSYDIKVVHYAGNSLNGIESVIDREGKGAFKSVIAEMMSYNIDLYYCDMTAVFTVTKQNAFLHFEVSQISGKDLICYFSYCDLKLIQRKNVEITNCVFHFYPTKRIKRLVFVLEMISSLFVFTFFMIVYFLATSNRVEMEMVYNPGEKIGIYPYIVFLPIAIADIVLIIIRIVKISKYTLRIE